MHLPLNTTAPTILPSRKDNLPACYQIKTCHETLVAYDADYHLTHSLHPENSAFFFTYENGGFLVPTTLELSSRDMANQFVFPFLLTDLGKERFAFKDPSTGLYLCALPPGHRAISIDRSIIDIWETYSLIAAEEKTTARHPAQDFFVTHRLENLLNGLTSKAF